MITLTEYAQLSVHTYDREENKNRMFLPEGYEKLDWQDDDKVGFSAGTYKKNNSIVIAFTGTNEGIDKDFNNIKALD